MEEGEGERETAGPSEEEREATYKYVMGALLPELTQSYCRAFIQG
jgi:hypothetical protein